MDTQVFERYGLAFAELCSDPKAAIVRLETLAEALRSEPRFARMLGSPKTSPADKKKAAAAVLAPFKDELLTDFVGVIIDNSRGSSLGPIIESTLSALYRKTGVKRGYLFSASPLDDETRKEIEDALSRRLGETVRLRPRLDPGLIGGIKVALDDKVYDASLLKRLGELKNHLLGGSQHEN